MIAQIYKKLIKEAEGPTYLDVRLKLTLCLLAITDIRINELLNITVSQLKTLTQESCSTIDRSKRGPSNHKAFLTNFLRRKERKLVTIGFQTTPWATKHYQSHHSFRIVHITLLRRDYRYIEFVKQSIGHQKLDTTSAYVTNLSDQERQDRIANV